MATIGDALYDVFGPGRADGGMDMRAYDPAFGEEERVAIQAQLPQLTGRVPIATGPTGVYGRLLADAGRRQAAQAAALGELVTAARGQRMRARDEALIQKQREERAANEATRLQQARLRKNILAGVGEFGENVMSYLQSPAFQAQLQAQKDAKAARAAKSKAFGEELDASIAGEVGAMKQMTNRLDASPRLAPELDFSIDLAGAPVTSQQKAISRTQEGMGMLGDVAKGYQLRQANRELADLAPTNLEDRLGQLYRGGSAFNPLMEY